MDSKPRGEIADLPKYKQAGGHALAPQAKDQPKRSLMFVLHPNQFRKFRNNKILRAGRNYARDLANAEQAGRRMTYIRALIQGPGGVHTAQATDTCHMHMGRGGGVRGR